MAKPVRVRFAPSPTGYPHVGNIRTALFNWLFARHSGGKFIVRIEDTDVARTVPGAVEGILDGLRWLGLDWDEGPEKGGAYGPYYQSQRLELYQQAAQQLVAQGDAYYCYCSSERLKEMREEQRKNHQPPGYDRHCRNLTDNERAEFESKCIVPVVRFKVPLTGSTTFHDFLREDITFENITIDDFVLLKSDGYPTYHLANIVDDHAMEISYVMRAEEWLSSGPRHKLLYQAMGYEMPELVHLPMILGPDKSKLSKRHGAVSITDYDERGYLPQTMVNFLALLGWSFDDKTELFTCEELVEHFTLERVSRTSAIFNHEKLDWMNGIYIRKLTPTEFFEAAKPFLVQDKLAGETLSVREDYLRQILPLIQERVKTLAGIPALIGYFLTEELEYETGLLIQKKMDNERTVQTLKAARAEIEPLAIFDNDSLEKVLRPLVAKLELKTGQLFGTLRSAVTGSEFSPPLFEMMAVLGKERCLQRIDKAIDKLIKSGS